MKPQECYDNAAAIYEEMYNTFTWMSNYVAPLCREIGKPYNPDYTLQKLDVVLQYSLLQIAVSDYDLDSNEILFIRDLTNNADLVIYLNNRFNLNLSWEGMINNISTVKMLLDLIYDKIWVLAEELITVFSVCDLSTPEHDYLFDLGKQIYGIGICLASVDKRFQKSEMDAPCVFASILCEIRKIKTAQGK